jgi:tRNA pseudouridine38-40 synthase
MKNIALVIEYDGTNYFGFQKQKNLQTIQGILEEKLYILTKEKIKIFGAGRTDAKVHALGQVVNFKSNIKIPIKKIPYALNSILPNDIVVKNSRIVKENFHARYSAKSKVYHYLILNRKFPSPFFKNYAYFIQDEIDLRLMNEAINYFIGVHDFASFRNLGTKTKTTVCKIINTNINKKNELIKIEFEADRFLYGMVRIMVSALIDVGKKKVKPKYVKKIIELKNRNKAPSTAPPQGLYLVKVNY